MHLRRLSSPIAASILLSLAVAMLAKSLVAALALSGADAFQLPNMPKGVKPAELTKLPAALSALAITAHSEAAHAKSVLGVNGALDFGPLAGDQPGGEGTGKVRLARCLLLALRERPVSLRAVRHTGSCEDAHLQACALSLRREPVRLRSARLRAY